MRPPAGAPPARPGEDEQDGFGLAALLFVCSMMFYLISIQPFVDLTTIASVDPAANKSNSANQIAFLLMTAALWVAGVMSPLRSAIARPRFLISLIFIWFVAVSIISDYPDIALKRVVLAGLTCINAGILLTLPKSDRQFARLLAFAFLAMLAVAYYGILMLPYLAIHQAGEIREPMNAGLWRGHFPHKNAAAAVMVLTSFVGLFVFRMGQKLAGAAIVVLAVIFLAHTGGKTSTAALPGTLIMAWAFERFRLLRIPIAIGGLAGFNLLAVGSSVSPAIKNFVISLGVDASFTNRTDVWRIAFEGISQHPITGYGFQLFWQTDELVYSRAGGASWAVQAYNGHNAYLDMALTTGIPGFLLAMTWILILPLRDVAQAERTGNSPALTTLFVRIWLYGIFTACVESLFFQSGSVIWIAILFALYGLRLQARARVVSRDPAARTEPAHAYA